MQLPFSLDLLAIVDSAGSTALKSTVSGKRSARGIIAIPIINGGARVTEEVAGLLLKFVAKTSGLYDSTPIVSVTDFVWSADRTQYEAVYDWESNTILNASFGVQDAAANLSSGDETTEVITSAAPHGLAVNDRIWFPTLTGGAGITAEEGAWYYVKTVPSSTTFTISASVGGALLNFTTPITDGTVRKDPLDVASVPLAIEIGARFDPGDPWSSSENDVALTLANNYLRNDDGAPEDPGDTASELWLSDRALRFDQDQTLSQANKIQLVQNGQFIATSLTGGAAKALDSIVTAGGVVSEGLVILAVVAGVFSVWQLQAGSTAENADEGVVRPDDYAGGTNEFIWTQVA